MVLPDLPMFLTTGVHFCPTDLGMRSHFFSASSKWELFPWSDNPGHFCPQLYPFPAQKEQQKPPCFIDLLISYSLYGWSSLHKYKFILYHIYWQSPAGSTSEDTLLQSSKKRSIGFFNSFHKGTFLFAFLYEYSTVLEATISMCVFWYSSFPLLHSMNQPHLEPHNHSCCEFFQAMAWKAIPLGLPCLPSRCLWDQPCHNVLSNET